MENQNMMKNNPIGGGRIEILDILKGYAILMVVFGHVLLYSFHGTDPNSYNKVLATINMPIFFFVSGYILWKPNDKWSVTKSLKFLFNKFKVLVLSAIVFLCIYSYFWHFGFHQVLHSCTKVGYWFTIELFQYYFLYVCTHALFDRLGKKWTEVVLILLAFFALVISIKPWSVIPRGLYDALDLTFMRHLVFFYLGTVTRRYQQLFEKAIDNSKIMCVFLVAYFICIVLVTDYYIFPYSLVLDNLMGLFGIVTVFALFRKYEASFSRNTRVGKVLQYVGRHTLDIYFLHYFFLPRNLSIVGEFFHLNSNPILEFAVCSCVSVMVIAVSLLVSSIIRLSPNLSHLLFGARK